jgi:hypothetical protein
VELKMSRLKKRLTKSAQFQNVNEEQLYNKASSAVSEYIRSIALKQIESDPNLLEEFKNLLKSESGSDDLSNVGIDFSYAMETADDILDPTFKSLLDS